MCVVGYCTNEYLFKMSFVFSFAGFLLNGYFNSPPILPVTNKRNGFCGHLLEGSAMLPDLSP